MSFGPRDLHQDITVRKVLTADCDYDTILAKVSQVGAACHTGNRTCFFRVTDREERIGLDISQHGENAYPSFNGMDQ